MTPTELAEEQQTNAQRRSRRNVVLVAAAVGIVGAGLFSLWLVVSKGPQFWDGATLTSVILAGISTAATVLIICQDNPRLRARLGIARRDGDEVERSVYAKADRLAFKFTMTWSLLLFFASTVVDWPANIFVLLVAGPAASLHVMAVWSFSDRALRP